MLLLFGHWLVSNVLSFKGIRQSNLTWQCCPKSCPGRLICGWNVSVWKGCSYADPRRFEDCVQTHCGYSSIQDTDLFADARKRQSKFRGRPRRSSHSPARCVAATGQRLRPCAYCWHVFLFRLHLAIQMPFESQRKRKAQFYGMFVKCLRFPFLAMLSGLECAVLFCWWPKVLRHNSGKHIQLYQDPVRFCFSMRMYARAGMTITHITSRCPLLGKIPYTVSLLLLVLQLGRFMWSEMLRYPFFCDISQDLLRFAWERVGNLRIVGYGIGFLDVETGGSLGTLSQSVSLWIAMVSWKQKWKRKLRHPGLVFYQAHIP